LTEEDEARLQKLGDNGDVIDPNVWGRHTSSVTNYQASSEEVLGGRLTVTAAGEEAGRGKAKEGVRRSAGS
jgi:catalase